jgi:hypothetical protein
MKVFWSWQADTPGATGRFFIRDALLSAIEYLREQPEILEPTEREPAPPGPNRGSDLGQPDLLEPILDKIEEASVFIADVTTAGQVPVDPRAAPGQSRARKLIDADVAIEIGYAAGALPRSALLTVMNTYYGDSRWLPAVLRRRADPITYTLAPSAGSEERDNAFRTLQVQFIDALKPFAVSTPAVEVRRGPVEFEPFEPVFNPATFFSRYETLATAGEGGEQEFNFPSTRVAYLRFYPNYASKTVGPTLLGAVFDKRMPCPMSLGYAPQFGSNVHGRITFEYEGQALITALTQGFPNGELWGISTQLFTRQAIRRLVTDQRKTQIVIPVVATEKVYLRSLRNYVQVAAAFGFTPPYTIVVGMVGIKEAYLAVPGGLFNNGELAGPIVQDTFQQKHVLESTDDTALKNLLRRVFISFYAMANRSREDVLTDQLVTAQDLPPR